MKMEEWKECTIQEITTYKKGFAFKLDDYKSSGIKIVKVSNLNQDIYDISKYVYLDPSEETKYQDVKLRYFDVIISTVGSWPNNPNSVVGKVTKIPRFLEGCFLNQNAVIFRVNDLARQDYLYYLLKDNKFMNYITGTAQGSASQASIKLIDIMNYSFLLPPLPTQQKIAAILSSLDNKIELNNKINTNLEQQAQALFKNWFVDFEPFGGKMPEGWKEADIYSIANIIYGSPFASKLFNTEKNGKPIIRIRDLKNQHSDVYTPEERDDAYLIQPKDIVVGMDGEFRPYIWGNEPGWLNQRVCVFENKRPKGKAFLYFSIKPLLDVVEKTQVATTVIHIGKKDFDKFRITLPTEEVLDKFDELTDSIIDQIVANRLENRRLAELRDTLLPKLMNGEIVI